MADLDSDVPDPGPDPGRNPGPDRPHGWRQYAFGALFILILAVLMYFFLRLQSGG